MAERRYFYRTANQSSLGPSVIEVEVSAGSLVVSPEQVKQIKAWRDGARFNTDRANDATAEFRSGWTAALDAVLSILGVDDRKAEQ